MTKVFKTPQKYTQNLNTPVLEQKEYFLNWSEWALRNRTQIIRQNLTAGANATLYTVPSGYRFILTSASIVAATGVATEFGYIFIDTDDFIILYGKDNSLSFPAGILVKENSSIILNGVLAAGAEAYGCICGFLEPNPSG